MDHALQTTCRETGILKTEENASEFRICKVCGGPTHKTAGSLRRTTYDLTKDNKVHSETVDIPADDLFRKEGFRCSYCGEPFVNLSDLQDTADSAQVLHDGAVEGTDPGEYTVGSKVALQTSINSAQALIDADDSTQEEIDIELLSLQGAIESFNANLIE